MGILTIAKVLPPLRNSQNHSKLGISPDELDPISIVVIIVFFIARTFQGILGLGPRFTSLHHEKHVDAAGEKNDEQAFALPDISLSMPLLLKPGSRKVFDRAIEPRSESNISSKPDKAQICLFLAAVSEPAMLLLLAKQDCPIRPLGAVNVRNRFEIIDFRLCKALFESAVLMNDCPPPTPALTVFAKFPRPARRVRRGIEIDIEVSIVADQAAMTETQTEMAQGSSTVTLFRQEFTMLQFTKFKDGSSETKSMKSESVNQQKPRSNHSQDNAKTLLFMPILEDSPYLWAQLCKDYNPIHFSPILAKLLGQPGQLAHGNHVVAVCLQAMSRFFDSTPQLDSECKTAQKDIDAMKDLIYGLSDTASNNTGWGMEVKFRRPVVLPATLGPRVCFGDAGFEIVDSGTGKVAVEVSIVSR